MKVIGYTDVIQVLFLIVGGLATTCVALNLVSEKIAFFLISLSFCSITVG
jgi:SSS family solute:Na+ symporter